MKRLNLSILQPVIASKLSSIHLAAHYDKRAAGARSRAKLQVLWSCCALVVLGTLGDSQFLVRGYRKVYVDTFLCICVFFFFN